MEEKVLGRAAIVDATPAGIVAQLTDIPNDLEKAEGNALLSFGDMNQFLAEEHRTLYSKKKALDKAFPNDGSRLSNALPDFRNQAKVCLTFEIAFKN